MIIAIVIWIVVSLLLCFALPEFAPSLSGIKSIVISIVAGWVIAVLFAVWKYANILLEKKKAKEEKQREKEREEEQKRLEEEARAEAKRKREEKRAAAVDNMDA
ncbi:MAG: hypothetical protein K6F53_12000 [Lachnospiraceae bacterium]|nr:hypothetical protein [Lachnospiraceae bacterium]